MLICSRFLNLVSRPQIYLLYSFLDHLVILLPISCTLAYQLLTESERLRMQKLEELSKNIELSH